MANKTSRRVQTSFIPQDKFKPSVHTADEPSGITADEAAMREIFNPPETMVDANGEETPSIPPCRFSRCFVRQGMKTCEATPSLADNDTEEEVKENCFVNITPPSSQPSSPSLLEPTLHIDDETDGGLWLFFASTVKTAVFHLLNHAIYNFRQSKCYGCWVNHPSQRQHQCLEPYEQDFLLYNYDGVIRSLRRPKFIQAIQCLLMLRCIKAEDSKVEAYADSLLSQLGSETNIWGAIDGMYSELVGNDETIFGHLGMVTECWKK
ncbi:uncharacterized protein LOC133658755 [Entelurus aequoreus]|uniref:uncharacterized protein LOC133658755 n=1 Tax=Entelurus aequoreus TaxID=161455 RepID=UPI002B1CEEAE|nr:uncharacterized protein LOC133658755 [Entelurus aequoreus]